MKHLILFLVLLVAPVASVAGDFARGRLEKGGELTALHPTAAGTHSTSAVETNCERTLVLFSGTNSAEAQAYTCLDKDCAAADRKKFLNDDDGVAGVDDQTLNGDETVSRHAVEGRTKWVQIDITVAPTSGTATTVISCE